MTGKDDPSISCSHLMVELSVLAGRKINLKGVVTETRVKGAQSDLFNFLPPFGDFGIIGKHITHVKFRS